MSMENLRPHALANHVSTSSPEVDFALVLARVISSAKENPAELRYAIYELARIRLEEARQSDPRIDAPEMHRLTAALELAIKRVEASEEKHDELRALRSLDRLISDQRRLESRPSHSGDTALQIIDTVNEDTNTLSRLAVPLDVTENAFAPVLYSSYPTSFAQRVLRSTLRSRLVAAGVFSLLAIGLATILFQPQLASLVKSDTRDQTGSTSRDFIREVPLQAERPLSPSERDQLRGFPLPVVYGIYAVSDGKLYELDALPIRAPDQRIFMSAILSKPSVTTIPAGQISFLAYRRDLATNAPERVSVRTIAQVKRAMAVGQGGKAQMTAVNDAWAIRNVEQVFRVAPLSENSEMLLMRPDTADLVLSPGRYAMVINSVPYDFTVAGDVTDAAHCLERTVASNGVFYSECRQP